MIHLTTFLYNFLTSRVSWATLLLFVIFFEFSAWVFQHVLELTPCVNCIYERVAMLGIGLAAVIGYTFVTFTIGRCLGLMMWMICSLKGWLIAKQHVMYQINPNPFDTCELAVQFPTWLPLDKWVPWFFAAYGDCSEVDWQFMTLTMPQWLVIIFAVSALCAAVFIAIQLNDIFIRKK